MIRVQEADFNVGDEYLSLISNDTSSGAVVLFVGRVRDLNAAQSVSKLFLEHYPGMTEKSLQTIADEACARWPISNYRIIHRVGELSLADNIVLVGVSSPHREAAFEAAQFIMDYLKTQAPFWKREQTEQGELWVEANAKDQVALKRWEA